MQAAKCSDKGRTVLHGGRFDDAQGSCFQAAKRSDMLNAVLQVERFLDAQECIYECIPVI